MLLRNSRPTMNMLLVNTRRGALGRGDVRQKSMSARTPAMFGSKMNNGEMRSTRHATTRHQLLWLRCAVHWGAAHAPLCSTCVTDLCI